MTVTEKEKIPPIQKPVEALLTALITRRFSLPVTRWLAGHTNLTPNQVTLIAFFFSLLTAAAFAAGGWGWLILGAVLLQIGYTLDCCDGELARMKGMQSPAGAALDAVLDVIEQFLFILGAAWGIYRLNIDNMALVLGAADIGLLMIYYYVVDAWLGRHTGKETNKLVIIRQSMYISLKDFVIFGFTLFALINMLRLFLILLLFASLAGNLIQIYRLFSKLKRAGV